MQPEPVLLKRTNYFEEFELKKLLVVLLLTVVAVSSVWAEDNFKSKQEKIGYAIGMNIANSMRIQQLDIDPEQLAAGFIATFKGEKTILTETEMKQVLTGFQQEMQQKQQAEIAAAAAVDKDYLVENSKKDGVVTLASGLQYEVIKAGNGAQPTADATVEVHYRGTLVDGTEFDSSYSRGKPASFPVNRVIAGWTEALQLMKEGAKWQLVIPGSLAYGAAGSPPTIKPDATLIFEVELLQVL
ncbi:MAG: FKBP-type peptidyl-prolyl cis-trans isomerase [Desulfuromonadales bacterium]|nr:FKBP-type peptidyl-prolyl cis-trans isomerase [Desulfuromonadales bacterium]